ncbi:MAG: HD domain-containing protein, partial [Cetobacterium sp.]
MDKKNKIIKDLVHEYVEIDEKIQKIVDTKEFQRLKRVKQLTAIYIYPSANHTRFEHSLGVMKLAMDYYTSIEEKLRGIVKEDIEGRLQYYKVNLQIAALLHDLGHAPFSHLGEKFFDKEEIKNKIKATLKEEEANSILDGNEGAPHELMSCFCIKKLESKLKEIYG